MAAWGLPAPQPHAGVCRIPRDPAGTAGASTTARLLQLVCWLVWRPISPLDLPRRDMISAAQVALQSDRLKVASGLELASTLVTDLQAYDPDSPRNQNGDLVAAVAVAVWWAERLRWSEEVADAMAGGKARLEEMMAYEGRSAVTGY